MHPSLMIDIINTINAKLAEKVYKGWLLGAQVFIDPKKIEKERVSNGIFAFDYEFTVAPAVGEHRIEPTRLRPIYRQPDRPRHRVCVKHQTDHSIRTANAVTTHPQKF